MSCGVGKGTLMLFLFIFYLLHDFIPDFAFMGSLIMEQVIKDLIPKGLKHASKLILTGSR